MKHQPLGISKDRGTPERKRCWKRYIFYRSRQSNPQVPQIQGLDPALREEIRSHELNNNNNNNNNNNK